MLAHFDVQVHAQVAAAEPGGRVRVQADDVLAWHVRGEGEATLSAVQLGQDNLLLGIFDLDVHADTVRGGQVVVGVLVEYLNLVFTWQQQKDDNKLLEKAKYENDNEN